MLFVGDSLCCLRFILPRIPQIFTDFIYPIIRAPLCYLLEISSATWDLFSHGFHRYSQILYIPLSVLLCAICWRFPLLLEIYSPTDSTDIHRFYIFQYPCSSALSVGDSFAPNIRAHLCYLWETPSPPISVFICDICGSHPLHLKIILPQIPRIFTDASWDCSPTDSTLSLQKNTTQSHKLQNDQGKTMIAKDSFVPLL